MRKELVTKLRSFLPSLCNDLVFEDIAAPLVEKGVLAPPEFRQILVKSTEETRAKVLVEILAGKVDGAFDSFLEVLRVDYQWLVDEILNGASCSGLGDVTDSVPFTPPVTHENIRNHCAELSRSTSGLARGRKRCASPKVQPPSKKSTSPTAPAVENNGNSEQTCVHSNEVPVRRVDTPDPLKLSQGVTNEMMLLVKSNYRVSQQWTNLAHALGLTRVVNNIRVKMLVYGEDQNVCAYNVLQEWVGANPDVTLDHLLHALKTEHFNDVADQLIKKFAI